MKPFLSAAESILAICLLASFSCIPKQPAAKDADRDGLVDAHEAMSRPVALVDDAAPCLLYSASHDASGFWTLSALGCGFETFALLGRPNNGGPFGVAFDPHGFLYVARVIAWGAEDMTPTPSTRRGARVAMGGALLGSGVLRDLDVHGGAWWPRHVR